MRAWLEGRRMRKNYLDMKKAILLIQTMWRGQRQRIQFKNEMNSVVKVQALVRGRLVRMKFVQIQQSAVCIQRSWRAALAGREARRHYLEQKEGALKIQTWWRMARERRRFIRFRMVVVMCQAYVRGAREVNNLKKQKSAAVVVQRWFRACRQMQKDKEQFVRIQLAVVVMQATVRGWIGRRKFVGKRQAACLLQRQVRGWMARRRAATLRQQRRRVAAVMLLQRQVRGWMAMRRVAALRQQRRREAAVILLQRQVRGWLARVKVKKMMKKRMEERAAVMLQSIVRGWLARRKFETLLMGTRTLQRWWRETLLAKRQRQQFLTMKQSAVTLQAWWRKVVARRQFCRQVTAVKTIQRWLRTQLACRRMIRLRVAVLVVQRRWRARQMARIQQERFLSLRSSAIKVQAWWRGLQARALYKEQSRAVVTIQRWVRGWLARRYVDRKRAALLVLQKAIKRMAMAKRCRKEFLDTRRVVIGLQGRSRGLLARRQFLRLQGDKEYREQMRREAVAREEERRHQAAKTITQVMRVVVERRRFIKVKTAATTIQKYWRGHWHRKVVMEQWSSLASRFSVIKEIKLRLEEANAAAKPEDSLGARTASAIDYIFAIKDVAQLICAVKTLDFSTRLSMDCCMKMTEGFSGVSPVAQLVSLMTRCNRSVPHMEVVSTILDILLNVSRVVLTREAVSIVPNLLPDLFQTMLVYRDTGPEIFSKSCALLQVLSLSHQVSTQLAQPVTAKRLADYEMVVTKKRKLKEQNQKWRSFNVSTLPVPTARKPLRPANSNQLNRTSSTMGLNTTVTLASATPAQPKQRKPSTGE